MENCKKCGGSSITEKPKGPHMGVYCADCGAWQKWRKKHMGFGIDYSNTHENEILPEGNYEVVIKAAYEDVTKKSNKIFINITLIVRNDIEQSYKNKHLWYKLWKRREPSLEDKRCGDYSAKDINTLSKAAGLPNGAKYESLEAWLEVLKGKTLLISVKHEDFNGRPQVKVSYVSASKQPDCKHIFKDTNGKTADKSLMAGFLPIEESVDDDEVPF